MIMRIVLLLGLMFNLLTLAAPANAQARHEAKRPVRILHIMSFNSPYRWTDGQLDGFKAGLGTDVKAEYQIFQLDTKRQSSKEEQERNAGKARQLIRDWQPDLVYTSDDDAIQLVTRHYVGSPIPFVFSGVNGNPKELGIEGAPNITGVLEREHVVETIHLLQTLKPGVRRIQILSDNAAYWPQVIGRVRSLARSKPDFELVGVDQPVTFADFQHLALENPNKADAYLILGNFNFKDAKGANVPYPQLQRWLTENSKVPDMSFWDDRMLHGTLAGVAVSAFEQGQSAGKLARAILVQHQKPGSLPMTPTTKGVPVINLERARQLGITPRSTQLLSAQIVTSYEWSK